MVLYDIPNPIGTVLYLPQLLQQAADMLIVGLGAGGSRTASLQLRLEFQEAAHVVGLLIG